MDRSLLNELLGPARRYRSARPRLEALEARDVPALSVTDLASGATAAQLVASLTGAGSGVTISNVQFSGDNAQAGLFSGGNGIIGFDTGIVLGTGSVNDVVGPNDSGSTSSSFGGPSDSDLEAIQSGTQDAASLQFNFVTLGDTLRFDYVFSSEEYNEFVNSGVNDVFAFFLNGQNIALLPGTSTAVSIDTVNLNTNSQFFVDNESGTLDTQMDGLTVVLSVAVPVTPGAQNTIKLAIADVGDDAFDSNVFLRAGSFRAPPRPVFTSYRPLRYAFRDVEVNNGTQPPLPISNQGGVFFGESFDGNLTLLNTGDAPAIGDYVVTLKQLPPGVQLLNRDGISSMGPFIILRNINLPENGALPLRVPVKLSNPNLLSLSNFFVGPFEIDVAQM